MSDFTNGFWEIYIGVITIVGILACIVLLMVMSSRRVTGGATETTGHIWDEDLGEYNNPLPRWWMWLFYITIAFSIGYLVLYPGLGLFSGTYKWTSVGQYQGEMDQAEAQYGPLYAKFAAMDLKQVAVDPEARSIGLKLFLNNCAQCHASDGGGSKGFPNLTDKDWLYGGEPNTIKATITNGRNGVMPPFGAILGDNGVKDVVHYARSLSGLPGDSARLKSGQEKFATNCAACHGPEGKGNQQIGAPNLTDKIWLYGSSEQAVVETVTKGLNNQMPAQHEVLGNAKIHILAGYVYGLSNNADNSGTPAK